MDSKNDDSAGSDSLDKSLQKKCVVDEGQGEGGGGVAVVANDPMCNEELMKTEIEPEMMKAENSIEKLKTAKDVGDGGGRGSVSGSGCSAGAGSSCASVSATDNTTNHDGVPIIKADSSAPSSTTTTTTSANTGCASSSLSLSNCATTHSATAATTNSHAFETKVKQISKNLKETSLAESANANKKTTLEDTTSTSSSSSSASSTSSSPSSSSSSSTSSSSSECDVVAAAASSCTTAQGDNSATVTDMVGATSLLYANESVDELDQRSKKVRFHPDVKENDGGNRVLSKRKKILKRGGGGNSDESTSGDLRTSASEDDEMDLDEEQELEEEEEFDYAKTIAEAQDYLKVHPLTFGRSHGDKSTAHIQNGLLEEEDLPQSVDSSEEEEEDIYENVQPERGIERILGKQMKCGQMEYLIRYEGLHKLHWENEGVIQRFCPNLLMKYEQNRERRQERLMQHVAKRQNIRQRYTDF